MDDEVEQEPHRKNPIKEYYLSIRAQKNFMKSFFIRNFIGRYKSTYLGVLWNFISPLIYIVLLYIISTEIRGRDPEWLVMIMSGVAMYQILLSGVTSGCNYFIGGANMIKKMAFPREILVYVQIAIKVVVSLTLYVIVIAFMFVFGRPFNIIAILYFPLVLTLGVLFTIGCSLILSSVTVYVRDIQYAVTSVTMIFFVATPLRGPLDSFAGVRGELMRYNPFTYYIEPMHDIFYYGTIPDTGILITASWVAIVFLLAGAVVFRKLRHGFVERL